VFGTDLGTCSKISGRWGVGSMMNCPKCESVNPDLARFCLNCGTSLEAEVGFPCQSCGTDLPPTAQFCFSCGTEVGGIADPKRASRLKALQKAAPRGVIEKVQAARTQVEGERKPVTILFADIVGSTSLAERMDPEDWADIVSGAYHRVSDAIYRYEGTIAQLLGDGVLAFFGAPISHEDDPVRAVHAALDIQESIGEYRRELEGTVENFQMRVGVNTGTVVIGDIGTDMHMEYLAFGDAVNMAARVERAAEPGTILLSEETHNLTIPCFKTEALEPIHVRGKTEPFPVYRVIAATGKVRKVRGVTGLDSPLVGRSEEFRALLEAIEQLQAGEGGIVTLLGEAGLGKSRLVAELRKATSSENIQWVEGRCLSYGRSMPYHPWLDMLRDFFIVEAERDPVDVRDGLHQQLQVICPDRMDDVYPYLAHLISLPLEDDIEESVQYLSGEQLKTATFHAVTTMIECAANVRPLVLVCEDFHWADPTSIELLQIMLSLTGQNQLLIICVFRPDQKHDSWRLRNVAIQQFQDRHTDIKLDRLSEGESEILAQNLLAFEELPTELRGRILNHAEGNPFYVEEILRALIDDGALLQDEGIGSWALMRDISDIPIPDTLHGVLLARIDGLEEDVKRMLQMASVIGRRFEGRLLKRIVPFREDAIDEYLATLETKEFMRSFAIGLVRHFVFKHALTQEVAYETLLKRDRRDIHDRVGQAIEDLFIQAREEQVEVLAHHFLIAENWEKSWTYHIQAGRKARERFANQEAVEFLKTAKDNADHLPQLDAADISESHILMADVLGGINQYDEALEELDQALGIISAGVRSSENSVTLAKIHQMKGQVLRSKGEYAEAIQEIQRGIDDLIEENPKERGALKIAMASALTRQGELEEAQRWCEDGIQDAEAGGDKAELAHAYSLLGTIRRDQGDTTASLAHRRKSLQISQEIENISLQMEAHNNLAVAYYDLGQLEEAVTHYEQSRELSERIGNLNTAARAEINLGEVHLIRGDCGEAEKAFRHALEIWGRTGYSLGQAYGSSNMGAVLTRQGMPEEALEYLQRSQELFTEIGGRGFLTIVHRRQAAAHLALGDLDTAEGLGLHSLELARELSMTQEEGAVLRVLGEIYRAKGQMTQAEEHLERSAEIFRDAGVQYEEARALYQLANVWLETEDSDRILPALDRAIGQFKILGAKVDLERAEALRSKISS
jgi:class 3 adenylate cyclase/tetratricopeptide (TPR) repeat protein